MNWEGKAAVGIQKRPIKLEPVLLDAFYERNLNWCMYDNKIDFIETSIKYSRPK